MATQFGAKLHWLRERDELTQSNVAQRIGLASHSHIAKVEAGQDRPSLDLVVRVALLFEVSADYLLRDGIAIQDIQLRRYGNVHKIEATTLGERIRALRQHKGFTQTALAKQLGNAGQSGIGKIERGEKLPSLERLEQIANILAVSIDSLLFG